MHLVNGGGDIQTGSGFWGVGISNPFDPRESIRTLEGTNFAVATSGSGERGKHIVNPFTGEPPSFYESITLVGKQISQLDPLATVAFLLSPTECRTFLNSTPTVSMGLAITHDGTVIQLK
jgi:thiamine biosynthesis lipoprotein